MAYFIFSSQSSVYFALNKYIFPLHGPRCLECAMDKDNTHNGDQLDRILKLRCIQKLVISSINTVSKSNITSTDLNRSASH